MMSTPRSITAGWAFAAAIAQIVWPAVVVGQDRLPAVAEVPLAVAVDTSRSLRPAELAAVVAKLGETLALLPTSAPAGLVAFDDAPRWLVKPWASPAALAPALVEVAPRGEFTQLNDALFFAVRALERGGVVLLVTDGRDEDSATTVDDIARRCEAQGVRILALGAGARIDRRSLRRLALLSEGAYLGTVEEAVPAAVAAAIEEARGRIAAARASSAPVASSGGVAERTEPRRASAVELASGSWRKSVLALGTAVLLAALAFLVWRGRFPGGRRCPACGDELDGDRDCVRCVVEERRRQLLEIPVLAAAEAREISDETVVIDRLPEDGLLEHTRRLSRELVLEVRERGGRPRLFRLDGESAFAVGRDVDGNTLAVPDPSLSAHHLRIVPEVGNRYVVVDLHSTNGTHVEGERVDVADFLPGNVVTAGHVEIRLRLATDLDL